MFVHQSSVTDTWMVWLMVPLVPVTVTSAVTEAGCVAALELLELLVLAPLPPPQLTLRATKHNTKRPSAALRHNRLLIRKL